MVERYLPVLSNLSTTVPGGGGAAAPRPRPCGAASPRPAAAASPRAPAASPRPRAPPAAAPSGAGPRPRPAGSAVGASPLPTYTLPALSTAIPDGSCGHSYPLAAATSHVPIRLPVVSNARICGAAKQHELAHGSSVGPFSLFCSESTPRWTTQIRSCASTVTPVTDPRIQCF